MSQDYKAISYVETIHHNGSKGDNPWEFEPEWDERQTRYKIVSIKTGEVLDDAQGYGYKTAQKAYSAYGYKNRDKSKDKEKQQREKTIQQWMREHKDFVREMDDIAFEIAKKSWGPDDKFDSNQVKELLKNYNLEPEFTASELLKVWKSK